MTTRKRVTFVYRNYEGVGLGYLASYARELGHEVQLILYPDPWCDTYIKQKDKDSPMTGQLQTRVNRQLLREVVDFGPDLICFSAVTDDYQWCSDTASILKAATGAMTLFGGVHVTSVPDRVARNPNVDLIALGEGERLLARLLDELDDFKAGDDIEVPGVWYERGGELRENGRGEAIQDLDNLPFPAKDLFYARMPSLARTYTIMTSRGCPYQCTYCYNAVMLPMFREQGKWMRQRSVENVIEECQHAVKNFGTRHFLFLDDVFASNKKWVEEFSERYRSEVNVPFGLATEAVVLKDDVVRWLKEAGLVNVQIGIQTLNESSKERIARPESRPQLEHAMTALNKYKVHYQVDHMLGIPGETAEDQRTALEFYNEYRPDIISVFWLKYYPRLPIIDFAMEKGILSPDDIEDIEEGRNEASYIFGGNAPDFKRWLGYNTLFGWLYFLPKRVVSWFLEKPERVNSVAFESYVFAAALPRLIATFIRRPDFRGRDHLRRLVGQYIYIWKIVAQDYLTHRRDRKAGIVEAEVPVGASATHSAALRATPSGTLVGRRTGGKVYAVPPVEEDASEDRPA